MNKSDRVVPRKPGLVEIKLTAEHTHKGEGKVPGDIITVRDDQAKRLIDAERAVSA